MISWLQGRYMECWSQGNRSGIVLVCHSVGYEVQLTARHMHLLDQDDDLALWIHQVQREDGSSLFGFPEREERDLFRMLIGVNGIGPQSGLSLLQECKPTELVQAIGNGDIRRLCRAQGIGKRTAERLAVDLRKPITTLKGIEPKPSLVEGIDSELMKETANEVSTKFYQVHGHLLLKEFASAYYGHQRSAAGEHRILIQQGSRTPVTEGVRVSILSS